MKFAWLLLTLTISSAVAHELDVAVRDGMEVVTVRASYGGRDPAAFANVAVFAPGEPMTEYQTGQTDLNGNFSFLPNEPGEWEVLIDDGTGHRDRTKVAVASDSQPEAASQPAAGQPLWHKLTLGISLIIGLTGFLFGMANRKARQ